MTLRIFIWVQTRLGIGHLARMISLGSGLAQQGFAVTLAHGGLPVPALPFPKNVTFIQLPPASAPDLRSDIMTDADGNPVTDSWRARRCEALMDSIATARPDIFMTETFPFGRRIFGFELEPLLQHLRSQPRSPLIVASLRDILVAPATPGRAERMIALADRYYDVLLCHTDTRIGGLLKAFPGAAHLSERIKFTGYIAPRSQASAPAHRKGILVTAGGGAVGEAIIQAAVAASRLADASEPWTIVTGPRADPRWTDTLQSTSHVTIHTHLTPLHEHIRRARLLVGQAGYNTVIEALAASTPMIAIPYIEPTKSEQTDRAQQLAALNLLTHLAADDLTPESLLQAVNAITVVPLGLTRLNMDGIEATARILRASSEARTT